MIWELTGMEGGCAEADASSEQPSHTAVVTGGEISEATLHMWRAEARGRGRLLPAADSGPEGWSSRDKFASVLESAALNEANVAEY